MQISLQNFKPLFPVILRFFGLECHGQVSLKLAFIKIHKISSWNLENWNASTCKNKTQSRKNLVFSLHKWSKNYFQNIILSFWLTSSDWNLANCSIEFKWTWISKAAVQQSFTNKDFWKSWYNSHENICNSNKKRLQCRCFFCEFCEI